MSYNIRGAAALYGGAHIERIASVIRAAEPDVVALQEVHRGTWKARYRDQLAELSGGRTGLRLPGQRLQSTHSSPSASLSGMRNPSGRVSTTPSFCQRLMRRIAVSSVVPRRSAIS